MAKEFEATHIWVRAIPLKDTAFYAIADAAWANAKDQGSQAGWISLAGDRRTLRGQWGTVSPLS